MEQNKIEAAKSFDAPETKLHFLDYWRIIRIRKTVILAVFLLVSLTTTLVTFILPEAYSSTVRIQVEKDSPDVAGVTERTYLPAYDPYWIQTEFEKIQSKTVLYKVIERLGLNQVWAKKYKDTGTLPNDVTFMILKSMLDVRQSRNTSLIEIRVVSEKAFEAAQIANKIAEIYGETRRSKRQEVTERGIVVLREQWAAQDQHVREMQTNVSKLKDELQISDVEAAANNAGSVLEPETLRRLEQERISSSAHLASIETSYKELSGMKHSELKQAITVSYPDSLLNQLLENETTTQQKLADLLVTYSSEHPEVQRVAKILQTVTNQVNERIDGFLSGLKAKLDAQRAEVLSMSN
ncbi:MAG: Wzz/FepE/Etk N-terminal domain-containing protein [Verrucomicrobia bacterium]|nr:Wzz/FepE/Etk N-terminal domain-containing protein [Verrucomicrobiota bacterium]